MFLFICYFLNIYLLFIWFILSNRSNIGGVVKVFLAGILPDEQPPNAEEDAEIEKWEQGLHQQQKESKPRDDGGWGADEAREQLRQAFSSSADVISVSAAPCEELGEGSAHNVPIAVTLAVPDQVPRIPVDICCVIDVSGQYFFCLLLYYFFVKLQSSHILV